MATTLNPARGIPASSTSEASQSAVNWAPIFAGAVVAAATTLILVAVGSGLGFASASPWPGAGPSAATFAIGIGIWLIVTQWLSSALGGYIAGRLRTRWTGIHTHEVLFRDTAHGLLAWAAATILIGGVALMTTASAVGSASTAATTSLNYATDTMLRSDRPSGASAETTRMEITRLLGDGSDLQGDDKRYLANKVAMETGLTPQQAQQRVDVAVTSIRESADKARRASSALAFFTALSMLIGAFIASAAAAYGGHLRDESSDIIEQI